MPAGIAADNVAGDALTAALGAPPPDDALLLELPHAAVSAKLKPPSKAAAERNSSFGLERVDARENTKNPVGKVARRTARPGKKRGRASETDVRY